MGHCKDGGPAFPASVAIGPSGDYTQFSDADGGGMSLRDWFAGQALAGFISNSSLEFRLGFGGPDDARFAKTSYLIADAMLKERENELPLQ